MSRPHGHTNSPEKENAVELIYEEIIDEAILGLSFQIHRSLKLGTYLLDELDDDSENEYAIVDEVGLDVFGQVPMKKQLECTCPNCQRNLAASRFAPHLEKCMGMGRSSSRIANRRIANSGKDAGSDDDENDDDWTYSSDRKANKKKRDKPVQGNSKRSKSMKLKNGDSSSVGSSVSDSSTSTTNYENLSADERKVILMQMCGVISEHTKKMCTRSLRCPQHSDEQRKAVRGFLLGQQTSVFDVGDDIQVDIDSFDDVEAHRDHLSQLWEGGLSANPSPSDSSSTNNSSTSSKKKEPKSKSGGSNGRNKKGGSVGSQNSSSPKGK
ncbi:Ataxin-7-like protein 3, variant 2 [Chamberlinius hualienensis]